MSYLKEVTILRVAIFESTPTACELLSRALEASLVNIRVVRSSVSSEFNSDGELKHANVAVISLTFENDDRGGLMFLRRLSKEYPNLNCVLLLDKDDREIVTEAFRSGAVGVFDRSKPYEELCKCIVSVHNGQVWANSRQLRYVLGELVKGMLPLVANAKGELLLTKREHQITSMVAQGMKNQEIAEALNIVDPEIQTTR